MFKKKKTKKTTKKNYYYYYYNNNIIIISNCKKKLKKKIIVIIYNYLSAIPRVDSLPRFHAQAWLSENTTIIINKKHICKQNHTK